VEVRKDYNGAERDFCEALRCDPGNANARAELRHVLSIHAAKSTPMVHAPRAPRVGELCLGTGIVLVGLASTKYNGARGAIVSGVKEGRGGVKLASHGGKAMAIKTENIGIFMIPTLTN
jgi:hypothetical protein